MDLGKIKNFIRQNGDKFIVVENDEPELVVMSFGEYEKLVRGNTRAETIKPLINNYTDSNGSFSADTADLREPFAVHEEIIESAGLPVRLEDIRLEDLPI